MSRPGRPFGYARAFGRGLPSPSPGLSSWGRSPLLAAVSSRPNGARRLWHILDRRNGQRRPALKAPAARRFWVRRPVRISRSGIRRQRLPQAGSQCRPLRLLPATVQWTFGEHRLSARAQLRSRRPSREPPHREKRRRWWTSSRQVRFSGTRNSTLGRQRPAPSPKHLRPKQKQRQPRLLHDRMLQDRQRRRRHRIVQLHLPGPQPTRIASQSRWTVFRCNLLPSKVLRNPRASKKKRACCKPSRPWIGLGKRRGVRPEARSR